MLYCYQIIGHGELSILNRSNVSVDLLQSQYKGQIIELLKKYYFAKIEICNKNMLCSMNTDSVNLKISYLENTYKLTYSMFASTDKYFDDFQKIFSPDDFNLNFLVQDKQMLNNIGIEKLSVKSVQTHNQLLGCEEKDLPIFAESCFLTAI